MKFKKFKFKKVKSTNNTSIRIIKETKNIFAKAITQFAETIYVKKPFTINFDHPWLNVNRENHFNKTHTHAGSDLSIVFYCEVPTNSGGIVFETPVLHQRTTMIWYEKHDMWNSEYIQFAPKKYDLIIFPSYLPHEYVMSRGGNFKFIHWNLMALPRNIVMQEGSV